MVCKVYTLARHGIQLVSHSLIRSDLDIKMTRLYSKIGQFYKFWSFSKISLILSASTPPSYLVVNDLLNIPPSYVWYIAGVTFPYDVRIGH